MFPEASTVGTCIQKTLNPYVAAHTLQTSSLASLNVCRNNLSLGSHSFHNAAPVICNSRSSSIHSSRNPDFIPKVSQNTFFSLFYSTPQCSHCKHCTSYGNSVCLSVHLSVCPSVTRRYCVKTTARSTAQFAPLDSKICLVL